jgi:hypothetical protein
MMLMAHLFSEVLGLCRESGLVRVGVVAIDGTKAHANASHHCNLDYEQLAREILKEAGALDAAEDELPGRIVAMSCLSICGPVRGDVLRCAKPSRSSRASMQAEKTRR